MAIPSGSTAHLPRHCLAPGGKGAEALVISNTRLTLANGRTFAQASLSDFYRGMHIISRLEGSTDPPEEGLFLPVRSFNPECLATSAGESVLSCLVDNCDYIVIEDADLRPHDLIEHMKTYSLHSVHIRDVTKAMGLTGNYAYIIWPKNRPKKEPDFGGKRIW
jgi:hypothetical protein